MARYSRIFAALDGGATQEAVCRRALSIAHDNNSDVMFGNVVDSSSFQTAGLGDEGLAQSKKESIEKELGRYLRRSSKDECIPSVTLEVRTGRITETLMEMIEPFNPDLVICGVRGLSDIKYAFVGSVSTHLIRHMKCDVLVVRPEAIEGINYDEYPGEDEIVIDSEL